MSKSTIKKALFFLIMAILFFPLFFQPFEGTITFKLKGYQPPPTAVELGFKTWMNGSWQKYAEAYTKYHLQARHFFIRLNNQLKFSLFDKLNANAVERGKNNFYFENRYIRTYLGLNFKGEDFIAKKVETFQELSDTLNAHNIKFLFVIASGKANFMPENIPEKYDDIQKTQNNYETYIKYLKNSSIKYLDLNQYLLEMKDTSQYPLYTKGNIHWSFYAISYITDTLIHTIENQLDKDLPDYIREPVSISYEPSYYTEGGIFKSLNLYWTELKDTFAYRNIIFDKEEYTRKYKPKVWVVGDSFYGTLNTYEIPDQFFDPSTIFFYYNGKISTLDSKEYRKDKMKNFMKDFEKNDMLIFFTTDAGLHACCWGAEKYLLDYYKN